ncbi:hypothetical protein [Kineosporia sp. A_224]|uniref:hypothetical protein n=1 Tax=Kineosporia sp. A_224 TaxID=1962180 RepID=UPI000B4ADB89|nr:hypothetical protein [Kineosporia sp. A_224]
MFGPTPLFVVVPAKGPLTHSASHPDVVDLTTHDTAPGPVMEALTDCTVLHGWLPAPAVTTLLALLALPTTVRVRAAVEHAARSTDRTAPGSAALCGLARALLSKFASPDRIAHDVADRARRLTAGIDPFPLNGSTSALHTVVALAADRPDDPGIVAPLFLRQHRLRAGETLPVLHHVPLLLVTGGLELHPASGDEVVVGAALTTTPGASTGLQRLANLLAPTPALTG